MLPSQGTYFLTTDISGLRGAELGDAEFCKWMTREARVAAIPLSAFYSPAAGTAVPRHLVRFAFCKKDDVLDEAISRLEKFFSKA